MDGKSGRGVPRNQRALSFVFQGNTHFPLPSCVTLPTYIEEQQGWRKGVALLSVLYVKCQGQEDKSQAHI